MQSSISNNFNSKNVKKLCQDFLFLNYQTAIVDFLEEGFISFSQKNIKEYNIFSYHFRVKLCSSPLS